MERTTLRVRLLAVALLTLGATAAQAQSWGRELRQDEREIWQDRRELHNDYRELARDRADYARARAAGDFQAMRRERMEIRQDMAEIHRDRAELRHDMRERRQDVRQYRGTTGAYRQTGWNHEWNGSWARPNHDGRAPHRNWRAARHDRTMQAAGWHGSNPASSAAQYGNGRSHASQGNKGRHLGWNLGRGNPHGS